MAKAAKRKTAARPRSKKAQYERFQKTAHDLGIFDEEGMQKFERSFVKIVPPKHRSSKVPR
jgi:hypothetical protein